MSLPGFQNSKPVLCFALTKPTSHAHRGTSGVSFVGFFEEKMTKIRRFFLPVLALVALFISACAGRTFLAKPEAVRSVQSIAVIGFDAYVSADIASRVNNLMGPELLIQTLSSGWRPNVTAPIDSKDAYAAFSDRISAELGVRTMSCDDVSSNPQYAELAKKYASGHSIGNLRVDGILSGESVRDMTASERESLRKALGVDALMAIEVSYWVDNSDTISEIGGERLWGRIDAVLYGEGEEPIWRDQADGERSKNGLPPLVSQEALGAVRTAVEEATQKSLDLLFQHLNSRCPDCRSAKAGLPLKAEESSASAVESHEGAPAEVSGDASAVSASPSDAAQSAAAPAAEQQGSEVGSSPEAASTAENEAASSREAEQTSSGSGV